jgi:hypothetical protein
MDCPRPWPNRTRPGVLHDARPSSRQQGATRRKQSPQDQPPAGLLFWVVISPAPRRDRPIKEGPRLRSQGPCLEPSKWIPLHPPSLRVVPTIHCQRKRGFVAQLGRRQPQLAPPPLPRQGSRSVAAGETWKMSIGRTACSARANLFERTSHVLWGAAERDCVRRLTPR